MFQTSSDDIKDTEESVDPFSGTTPKEAPDIDHVDSMIAQQMSNMTVQDREQAYLDVHGISPVVEETPELISTKLMEMENHIRKQRRREAYDIAESMNPQYVQNPEFRLMFLRADLFNAQNAAIRVIRHFETKRTLFGVEKLAVEITQDDLDKETMDSLYVGYSQYLRTPDRSGRIISVWVGNADHESYSITALHAQKNGIVSLLYMLSRESGTPFPYDAAVELPRLAGAIPTRVAAFHMAHNNKWLSPLLAFIKSSFGLVTRIRIRTHYGKPSLF
ncbi:MAG: hypothetical protein SGBAC_009560 [Bacillariaceae sp.]